MADDANKRVQNLTLNTLQVFMRFCEKHELRYFITGGALIGVMRHHGFIPWDDDIDIAMPRPDFDRFHVLLKTQMPEGFGICNRYTDDNWHFAMSQFIDRESKILIHLAQQPRTAHIWVDVFPLDGLPNRKLARWFRIKNVLLRRYLVQIAHIRTQVDAQRKRPLKERVVLGFCRIVPVGKLVNTKRQLDKIEKILRRSDYDKTHWCGNMLGRYREREAVPKAWFGTPKEGMFEGVSVKIPQDSHRVLTALYGDYMQLPPEEERVAHHVTVLSSRTLLKDGKEE